MTTPDHHPADPVLLDYASGSLPESAALILATHLALCPVCRRQVSTLEAIGGALLEDSDPEPVSVDCLAAVLARLDDPTPGEIVHFEPLPPDVILLPQPLRSYIGPSLERLAWRSPLRGIETAELPIGPASAKTRLMRIHAGVVVPRHSHSGLEMTLVLDGEFSDELGHYRRGDMIVLDASIDHAPTVGATGACLCLSVHDAPIRLTGRLGRFFNPFLRL